MKRAGVVLLLAVTFLLMRPAPAAADLTAFFGFSPTPASRSTRGFAFGLSLLIVGFEFEFGNTAASDPKGAPSLTTKMFNGLIQTPTGSTQLYFTVGGGYFTEGYRDRDESSFGTNFGGGIKLKLAGPIRARVDYRLFSLHGDPLYKNPRRFYAGINIAF
jgi:hypothetical protein